MKGHRVAARPGLLAAIALGASLALLLTGCSYVRPSAEDIARRRMTAFGSAHAKNVILMISDGCGYNMVTAADYYLGRKQTYESFPVTLGVSTFPVTSGYDPVLAWDRFDYVMNGWTDSAAAATAMATGWKTTDGVIGMAGFSTGEAGVKRNVVEQAEALGKATGVVTTVEWCGATPAGFIAHERSRDDFEAIARQMVASKADVVMGAGNPGFDDDGKPVQTPDYRYVGGEQTWDALVAGTAGGDADGDGKPDPWKLIQRREEFQALVSERKSPKRVLGTFKALTSAQQGRSGDTSAAPFAVPLNGEVPALDEMALGAMNVLDDDPQGYFLMIEGGSVDPAEHNNQPGRAIEEEVGFDRAVQAVIEKLDAEGAWGDTLLIVTADHETGYVTGPGSGGRRTWNPIVDNGKGVQPGMEFHTKEHTNSLVPLFANGAGASGLSRIGRGYDPVRKRYLDNAQIGRFILGVMH